MRLRNMYMRSPFSRETPWRRLAGCMLASIFDTINYTAGWGHFVTHMSHTRLNGGSIIRTGGPAEIHPQPWLRDIFQSTSMIKSCI